eukprot:CAMPEP_0184076606 /NCGR_PEP_ID=MMETSP0974-20121125/227_1 /TAXON_ID=483370 /ORGANISM="non described non described, Strain CCMP2097" /LENGTH=57 /DNA_ID=CAMNT_0026379155 /DNA_START=72 /DNA_END=245 /DNA_ORIENTATION=-
MSPRTALGPSKGPENGPSPGAGERATSGDGLLQARLAVKRAGERTVALPANPSMVHQ